MINIGIIGNNFGVKVHLPAFKSIENVYINSICKNHNWQDIIFDKSIDAICLSVPPTESFEILKLALKNNKHIFCEKPLAISVNNAKDIKELLNENIITAINFEICESRIVKKLRELIKSKYLGKIKEFSFIWQATNNNKNHIWKNNINMGGGALNNFGSHILNLIEYIFPDTIQNITAKTLEKDLEYNDYCNLFLQFSLYNGSIIIDTKHNPENNSNITLVVTCQHGDLILQNYTGILKNFSLFESKNGLIKKIDNEISDNEIDGRIELTNSLAKKFINGIKLNKQIRPNIQDGIRVQGLIDILINKG